MKNTQRSQRRRPTSLNWYVLTCSPNKNADALCIQTKTSIWRENMLRYFVRDHYLFREANSFPIAYPEENCELRRTDNVEDKYRSIFSRQLETIVFIIFQIFFAARAGLKIGEYDSDIPQFQSGHIQSRDVFRPIGREQKYLMAYKLCYVKERKPQFVLLYHCIDLTVLLFQQVRSIVIDVRRTISVSNLEQFSLLQEFASIH